MVLTRATDRCEDSSLPPIESVVTVAADIPETSVRPLPTHEVFESSQCGKKRKYSSLEYTYSDDSVSLPSLELEDELSELDDSLGDEYSSSDDSDVETESCCTFQKKRRKIGEGIKSSSDLIVILDLDECLIHFQMQDEKENKGAVCDKDRMEEDEAENNPKDDAMFVSAHGQKAFLRPGVVKFLKFVTQRFQTHIFTAGSKDYADPILDQLCTLVRSGDADSDDDITTTTNRDVFSKRWYRDDCDTIEIMHPHTDSCIEKLYVKPLSSVAEWAGRGSDDLRRIVHIDDQPTNFLLNHGNGIKVPEWRGDRNDRALSTVTKMLEEMDTRGFGDVRPHLRENTYPALKFKLDMLEFFPHRQTKGIAESLL